MQLPGLHRLTTFLLPVVVVLSGMLSHAQESRITTPARRLITQPISDAKLVQLRGNIAPMAQGLTDQGVAAENLKLDRMILMLKRPAERQQALDRLLSEQQNPKSPNYHKWLTPEQFGEAYGPSAEDVQKITEWLTGHGLRIDSIAKARQFLVFSGTNAQLQSAFHTSLHEVKAPDGVIHYAALNEPSVPSALADAISGIAKLNSFSFKPMHTEFGPVKRSKGKAGWEPMDSSRLNPQFTSSGDRTYYAVGPHDFATMYNVQPLWDGGIDGTGQTIAVIGKSQINPQDVADFRAAFGLPEKPVHIVLAGPDPGFSGSESEAVLDAEWAGATAPNAEIYLVTSASTATTEGLFLDSFYVIDHNLAPILSVSWGACEMAVGTSGNEFISQLWQQAAAQGITVLISTGDSGSAVCDQGYQYAVYGRAVNSLASTAYNVAVGGTDLYGSYTDTDKYWSPTNDLGTKQSVLSYVSEIPWNDSCGNPQIMEIYKNLGSFTGTTAADFCNSGLWPLNVVGGSGGASNCTVSDSNTGACIAGRAKPSWQAGVRGIPDDQVRDLPDISLFAGDGLWGSFYLFCQSDATPDGMCNYDNPDNVVYMAAGGTSFGTPAFAGIVALLNQKTGERQGNINPTLYKLAANQYSDDASIAACNGSAGIVASSCVFQDISIGSNAVLCRVGSRDCSAIEGTTYRYNILPGWDAVAGYDLATGIGTINAANMVNSWNEASSTFHESATSLSLDQTSVSYGVEVSGTIQVTAKDGTTGTPSGDTSVLSTGYANGPFVLENGTSSLSFVGLPAGTHQLTAHYAGDESFASSDSTAVQLTVNQAATTLDIVPSRTEVGPGESVTLRTTVATSSFADSPTGNVSFIDSASSTVLATGTLGPAVDSTGHAIAVAAVNVRGLRLNSGTNNIVASYAGDTNYVGASSSSVSISYRGPFTISMDEPRITVAANGSGSGSLTLTTNNGPLTEPVLLSCSDSLPAGLSCAFSPAVLPIGSTTTTSTLTIYASSALQPSATAGNATRASHSHLPLGGTVLLFAGIIGAAGTSAYRRRVTMLLVLAGVLATLLLNVGCGDNSEIIATTTSLQVSAAKVAHGNQVTFTAYVSPIGGHAAPSGSITFYENGVAVGKGTLANGTASFASTSLTVGTHSLTAVYSGDSKFGASASAPATTDITYTTTIPISAKDASGNRSTVSVSITVQ